VDDFRQIASDDAVALARAAADVIRGLNHATRCDAGLGQPSAAYDVIGALSLAASRLGQLLTQITGHLVLTDVGPLQWALAGLFR
jgi:hypothetical protein